MPKFFIDNSQIVNNEITIYGGDARHIAKVLRKSPGDAVVASCAGVDYVCEIRSVSEARIVATVRSSAQTDTEPAVRVTLCQALPKGDKFDLIIQKCVELGVHAIVPVITEHTVAKVGGLPEARLTRYNKIAEAAAKQSGRGYVPRVAGCATLSEAISITAGMDVKLAAHEKNAPHIKQLKYPYNLNTAAVFIGPEGGFSDKEVEQFITSGVSLVNLGPRVLRTETAAFTALIILLYETECL